MSGTQSAAGRAPVVRDVTARRFRLAAPVLAVVWFALVLALGVVSLPLAGAARQLTPIDVLNDVMVALAFLLFPDRVVGWRRLRHHDCRGHRPPYSGEPGRRAGDH